MIHLCYLQAKELIKKTPKIEIKVQEYEINNEKEEKKQIVVEEEKKQKKEEIKGVDMSVQEDMNQSLFGNAFTQGSGNSLTPPPENLGDSDLNVDKMRDSCLLEDSELSMSNVSTNDDTSTLEDSELSMSNVSTNDHMKSSGSIHTIHDDIKSYATVQQQKETKTITLTSRSSTTKGKKLT